MYILTIQLFKIKHLYIIDKYLISYVYVYSEHKAFEDKCIFVSSIYK